LASLALCEAQDRKVSDLLTCQVAANEIAGRLGLSAALGPLNGQMWSFIHLVAACSVAGRLRELTCAQMEDALALSLSMPPFPLQQGFFGTGAKLLTASWPAILGLQAAAFASEGLSGPRGILDQEHGFYEVFSYYPIRGAWKGLGKRWLTESLAIKPYPGCAYLDAALDALERILLRVEKERGRALEPSAVAEILVASTFLTKEMERFSALPGDGPVSPIQMSFSLRYTLAWRLIAGSLSPEDMTREAVQTRQKETQLLSERIHLVMDSGLNLQLVLSLAEKAGLGRIIRDMGPGGVVSCLRQASRRYALSGAFSGGRARDSGMRGLARAVEGVRSWMGMVGVLRSAGRHGGAKTYSLEDLRPEEFEFPFGSRLTLTLTDGTVFEEEQRVPVGAPGNHTKGLGEVAREKFRVQAEGLLGRAGAGRALKMLGSLSPETPVRALLPLICFEEKKPRRQAGRAPVRDGQAGGVQEGGTGRR